MNKIGAYARIPASGAGPRPSTHSRLSRVALFLLAAVVVAAAACSGGGGGGDDDDPTPTPSPTPTPVQLTLLFVHGPEVPLGTFAPLGGVPVDGRWLLTPESGSTSVNRVVFKGSSGNSFAAITQPCVIDYDRTSIAFTAEAECTVMLPPGTYQKVTLILDPTFELAVRDVTNNIYTDPAAPTGIVFAPPAGGAPIPVTIDAGAEVLLDRYTSAPIVVAATNTEQVLTFVVDMTHAAFMEKAGATGTLESFPPFNFSEPVKPTPALQRTQYYTPNLLAGNVSVAGTTNLDDDGLRVQFTDATQPAYLSYFDPDFAGAIGSWAVDHASAGLVDGSGPGGYLGVDSSGTMCWAMSSGYDNWSDGSSFRLCRMALTTTLGGATTIECDDVATIPVPSQGSTYASGCPAITPDSTIGVTLVAQ